MSLLDRLLGGWRARADDASADDPASLTPSTTRAAAVRAGVARRVSTTVYARDLAHVHELELMGRLVRSPDGRLSLVTGSIAGGSVGGRRDGGYAVIEDGALLTSGTAERPSEGAIADTGAFVLSDWLGGDALAGRFLGFRPDGSRILAVDFSANLSGVAISPDGSLAACQTLNSPGSPDSCIVAVFDLTDARELARLRPECGTAHGFEFDVAAGRVVVLTHDGDRETYTLAGEMVDREGWVRRRVARGDLAVIADQLGRGSDAPAPELAAALVAGLAVADGAVDPRMRARALRLKGELRERVGDPAGALEAYESALLLDPQVGVTRRADALRRATSQGSEARSQRMGRHQSQAARLGIDHEVVALEAGAPRQWRHGPDGAFAEVEEAALAHYSAAGWSGVAAEGGLMLTLLKAASFERLPQRHADHFVEGLYTPSASPGLKWFDPADLVGAVRGATVERLRRNWEVISATAGVSPAYYPRVRWEHVTGLFDVLGADRLGRIAEVFATAPYDLRAGWPDLTLWRGRELRFVEVKSPKDQMHASQARLISTLLLPLGFDVALAEVRERSGVRA